VSTRKLILTALLCGIAIVVAGGVKLFQVANEDAEVVVLSLGTPSTLGDMTVSVESIEQTEEGTDVTVSMGGVDGADATEGWRMLAAGKVVGPLAGAAGESEGHALQRWRAVRGAFPRERGHRHHRLPSCGRPIPVVRRSLTATVGDASRD
jgi:hypothetical protein